MTCEWCSPVCRRKWRRRVFSWNPATPAGVTPGVPRTDGRASDSPGRSTHWSESRKTRGAARASPRSSAVVPKPAGGSTGQDPSRGTQSPGYTTWRSRTGHMQACRSRSATGSTTASSPDTWTTFAPSAPETWCRVAAHRCSSTTLCPTSTADVSSVLAAGSTPETIDNGRAPQRCTWERSPSSHWAVLRSGGLVCLRNSSGARRTSPT